MIGAITGDIVGSRFEFNNHRSKDFVFFEKNCEATDDSIMSLCVAKAIMETARLFERNSKDFYTCLEKMTIKYMQEIGRNYPHCGYGGNFYRWIYSDNPQPYNSFGNGSAMRISAVGFYAKNEAEVRKLSLAVTKVSHNHREGIKGAEATAMAILKARQGCSKNEIRKFIEDKYYQLNFTLDEIRDTYKFNEICQDTVPQAIEAFLESNSFEDTIRNAISIGGDSDTIGAIAGGIAEAFYSVPDEIKKTALSYLDKRLLNIYNEWTAFLLQ